MARAYVALGSNLGDRWGHFEAALAAIGSIGSVATGSPVYETTAVGGPTGQGPYLNAVVAIDTDLGPRELLDGLLQIEEQRGRERSERWGPRTLDLDLLWYEGLTITEPGLTLPHPEIRNRQFVLAPLADIAQGLGDAGGPYVSSLDLDATGDVQRISGPVDPLGARWMAGLAHALQVDQEGDRFTAFAHPDWSNSSGDVFGAFLTALILEVSRRSEDGLRPAQLTYRYLKGVPSEAVVDITQTVQRASASSRDLTMDVHLGGVLVGLASVALIKDHDIDVVGPPAPHQRFLDEGVAASTLVAESGHHVGNSIRSWDPLERWDIPDLADGTDEAFRAWAPNVVAGSADPYLIAASMLMPIDALIWPATMQARGALGTDRRIDTPTIELTTRLGLLADKRWYRAEATIDQLAGRTVSGTVRLWAPDGQYLAVGHSLNLMRS